MAGDFDFFNDEPPARPPTEVRRRAPDDATGLPRASAPRSVSGLAIGAIFLGGVLVIAGGVVGIVLAVGGPRKAESKDKDGGPAAATTRPAAPKKDPVADLTTPSPEVVERVKKATVRILVEQPRKKGVASGSGFVEKDSRLVLTNAHVVGMRKMTDPQPLINLVVNSGEGDKEYRLDGEVAALDAENDLAVIRPTLLEVGKRTPVPEGLVVPKHPAVTELQKLFVFGFPLVDVVGSEISIRPTQVTSLRHEGGRLKRIQVEGGMTFGNSGGPVVDVKGNVVGVAVSGIRNENLNFCVPGELVQQLLARRNEWKD
jgi:S1-C subfamily serine protease